jgi:hypothetical protein
MSERNNDQLEQAPIFTALPWSLLQFSDAMRIKIGGISEKRNTCLHHCKKYIALRITLTRTFLFRSSQVSMAETVNHQERSRKQYGYQ